METSSEVVGLAPISTLVLASVVGLPYEPRIFFFSSSVDYTRAERAVICSSSLGETIKIVWLDSSEPVPAV